MYEAARQARRLAWVEMIARQARAAEALGLAKV